MVAMYTASKGLNMVLDVQRSLTAPFHKEIIDLSINTYSSVENVPLALMGALENPSYTALKKSLQ